MIFLSGRTKPSYKVHCAPQIPHVPLPVLRDGHQLGDGGCVMVCRGTWIHMVCHRCHQHIARTHYIHHLRSWTPNKVMCLEKMGAHTFTSIVPQSISSCQYCLLRPWGYWCLNYHVVYCVRSCVIDSARTDFFFNKMG